MRKLFFGLFTMLVLNFIAYSCTSTVSEATTENATEETASIGGGQSSVQDDVSAKDIVKVAVGSPDHTTLVKAVQAADLVNSLSNAGPFTVFAPVNTAFDALPVQL